MEASDKWQAIDELIDHLITVHEIRYTDRQDVHDAVVARERSLSTGLEFGVAVPHGSVDCVSDIVACIGISRDGIEFESRDGKPARIIVLLVIPAGGFKRHVRTLAGIARLAMNANLRNKILNAGSPDDVMEAILTLETIEESQQDS
jgi:mannitol/fructose-specific phosphotransferase system IIA component (Ntr-type)